MHQFHHLRARLSLLSVVACLAMAAPGLRAQQGPGEIRVVQLQGTMVLSTDGGNRWVFTQTNQVLRAGDRLRTGVNSRAALRWPDDAVLRIRPLAEVEILPPDRAGARPGLHIMSGILSLFHRDKPGLIRIRTRDVDAGVDGTEFVIAVDDVAGRPGTTLSVIDGVVSFTNNLGALKLTGGQQGLAEQGTKPVPTPGFVANNILQWAFYYPAVLDPRELLLTPAEETALASSLTPYRQGDLLAALAAYGTRQPVSESERIYQAALLLAVGEVEQSEAVLTQIEQANASDRNRRLAAALRQQIAAVKHELFAAREPELTTELMAASYYEQSRAGGDATLKRALDFAERAATKAPDFGFAGARVAELEFSFGRTGLARGALGKSLAISPRNAQAVALQGFLLAAQNNPREAIEWFDRAIAIDGALANAWLGRGLCRIRRGDAANGREDLLIAAALEPRRAQLRSYLGKSFGDAGENKRALHELDLAKQIDPNDPSAWLYSALIKADQNRINEAVRDLEMSQELNDNRSIYRSSLLLDQDRAVRSANLARIYRDAGMTDWSLHEAGRAVAADYANYSAHLFRAASYDELRDPNRINLRYETVAESEYLIANLLSPAGAGTLAQSISQQEYSKLLERDRMGVTSSTEYLSRGAWTENGAQFGTFRNSSYAVEALYRFDPGQRPNADFEQRELRLSLKQQVTAQDGIYFRVTDVEVNGGDVLQYYDQRLAIRGLRFEEKQEPLLSIGWHHEWSPGVHTLVLGSRLTDRFSVTNPAQPSLFVIKANGVTPSFVQPIDIRLDYRNTVEIYSAELQQIWQGPKWTTIVGTRYQFGDFGTRALQTDPDAGDNVIYFPTSGVAAAGRTGTDYDRLAFYAYEQWQAVTELKLVAGVSYDRVTFGSNRRAPPLTPGEETVDRVSPKAGFVWTPRPDTAVRFAYTRSLAGASVGQAYQLEPTEVAGFNQAFRNIIPESAGGAADGARFETFDLSLERKFPSGTYVALGGEILNSQVNPSVGVFEFTEAHDFTVPSSTREHLDFEEKSLILSIDQLVGEEWALGVRYRVTAADVSHDFVEIPDSATAIDGFSPRHKLSTVLHQIKLHAIYNHPVGFFAQVEGLWNQQSNQGYTPNQPGDDFWQFNIFAGYRFCNRRAEIRAGLLNLTDQNYRLNPLTLYNELPRERTFVAQLRFSF